MMSEETCTGYSVSLLKEPDHLQENSDWWRNVCLPLQLIEDANGSPEAPETKKSTNIKMKQNYADMLF
jgi:hypothetical protein